MNPPSPSAATAAPASATAVATTAIPGPSVSKEREKELSKLMAEILTFSEDKLKDFVEKLKNPAAPPTLAEIEAAIEARFRELASKQISPEKLDQKIEEIRTAVAQNTPLRLDDIRGVIGGESRKVLEEDRQKYPYPKPEPVPSNKLWFGAILALLILCFVAAGIIWYSSPGIDAIQSSVEKKIDAVQTDVKKIQTDVNGKIDAHAAKIDGNLSTFKQEVAAEIVKIAKIDAERLGVIKAQAEATKSISDNILAMKQQTDKVADIENAMNDLRNQTASYTNSTKELLSELGSIKTKLDAATAPPPLPKNPPIVQPPPAPPATSQIVIGGPDAGQGSASNGRAARTREWKMHEYGAGIESDRFCAKKFRKGEVRIVQQPDSSTTMRQFFPGAGFASRKRTPTVTNVPKEGSVPTFDDADKVAFQSSKPLVVWELD